MSTETQPDRRPPTPEAAFRRQVEAVARNIMAHHPKAQEAAARVGLAFAAAARAARNPAALYECTPHSVASCIALCALADLYPGGAAPAVYLVPQAPYKGGPMELQWRLTHRGMAAIAARSGWAVHTVPVSRADLGNLRLDCGEVEAFAPADPSATVAAWDDLAGVIVVLRSPAGQRVRLWVSVATIAGRRRVSRMADGGPWNAWPVQMAQGAAIREIVARGALPLELPDDTEPPEADAAPAIAAPAPRMLPAPVDLADLPDAPLEPEPVPAAAQREPGED